MTDTTDIKALWKLAAEVTKRLSETLTACNRRGYCDEALNNMKDALELAIATAEAERQQRDAAEKDSGELEQSLNVANAATQAWKQRANEAEASVGVLEGIIARKEFDSLKGEQVPFRYMAEWSSQYGGMEYDYSEVRSEMDEVAAEHDGSVIELFTAPQNPVVLPSLTIGEVMHRSGYDRQYAEGWVSANDNAIREIKAAGGIVKDGE